MTPWLPCGSLVRPVYDPFCYYSRPPPHGITHAPRNGPRPSQMVHSIRNGLQTISLEISAENAPQAAKCSLFVIFGPFWVPSSCQKSSQGPTNRTVSSKPQRRPNPHKTLNQRKLRNENPHSMILWLAHGSPVGPGYGYFCHLFSTAWYRSCAHTWLQNDRTSVIVEAQTLPCSPLGPQLSYLQIMSKEEFG